MSDEQTPPGQDRRRRTPRRGSLLAPLSPAKVAAQTRVYHYDEHEHLEFDVEDFLAAIRAE